MASTRRADILPEQMEAAIESIAVTGRYTQACNILGITPQVWRNWRHNESVLSERVKKAKQRRWTNSDYIKRSLAEKITIDTLRNGVKKETISEKEVLNPITGEVVTVVDTTTTHTGAPWKMVERYLVPENPEMVLIQQLADAGYITPEQLEKIENALNSLTASITGVLNPDTETAASQAVDQTQLNEAATAAIRRVLQEVASDIPAQLAERPVESESLREKQKDRD